MSTFKLGKFRAKYDPDTKGISYKWGEGDVHRMGGKSPSYEEDYRSDYDSEYTGDDAGYDERDRSYEDDRDTGYDEGYDDRDYASDDYGDDRYDDGDYADDGYASDDYRDDRDDDGYDYRYEDDYGSDGGGDDRGGYDEGESNGFLDFADRNPWFMYLMLVVLPPLGIWLLWRRGEFEQPVRIGISAASFIWFIVAIILIISALSGPSQDQQQYLMINKTITPTMAPQTIAPDESAEPEPTATAGSNINPILIDPNQGVDISVSPTPINNNMNQSGTYVYATTSGAYYHTSETCQLLGGSTPSRVTIAVCTGRGQYECPYCYNQDIYYANKGGSYYHTKNVCGTMQTSEVYTLARAKAEGKNACPTCAGGKDQTQAMNSVTTDKSGMTVYCTKNGNYFHVYSDCSGMQNASAVTLLNALKAGKKACPTCCASAGQKVYCTQGGTYYHSYATCSDMKNASNVTVAQALVLGKKKCPNCFSGNNGTVQKVTGYAVYATEKGTYYHTDANCSGMKGAIKVSLQKMLDSGRKPCPVCCKGANSTVYAVSNGSYYHSYATCSGMTNAKAGTLAQALAKGFKKCTKCWNSSGTGTTVTDADIAKVESSTKDASGKKVYLTKTSLHYHTDSKCCGMQNASKVSLTTAIKLGKTACTVCCSSANKKVYFVSGGKYYHSDVKCNDLKNPKSGTVADALVAGYKACPVCVSKSSSSDDDTKTSYKVGTSGIKVYAIKNGKYFHTSKSCAGSEATQVTLETALNNKMTACSKCASSAAKTVYATKGGKYYHISKSCAGSGATSGTLASALAYGKKACPTCVTGENPGKYTPGKSGKKVYIVKNGTYFHSDSTCAGSEATKVTLEDALNKGITKGCPKCASGANETVYASATSKYYHHSKSCAGSSASSGTIAKALARGLKECPVCGSGNDGDDGNKEDFGNNGNNTQEGNNGSAAGSTSVYINLNSSDFIYHKNKSCVSGTSEVTLSFARDWGYKACTKCKPPTKVSG